MAWYPKIRRRQEASAQDETDAVLAPDDLEEGEGEPESDDPASTLSERLRQSEERLAQVQGELAQLRSQNEALQAQIQADRDRSALAQENALSQAQLAAHAAAVRAFGQGSVKLVAAEVDIDACESEREAHALQRAYEAATPPALAGSERQTISQDPATAGRTSAQVKNAALTPEQKVAHQREMASRF